MGTSSFIALSAAGLRNDPCTTIDSTFCTSSDFAAGGSVACARATWETTGAKQPMTASARIRFVNISPPYPVIAAGRLAALLGLGHFDGAGVVYDEPALSRRLATQRVFHALRNAHESSRPEFAVAAVDLDGERAREDDDVDVLRPNEIGRLRIELPADDYAVITRLRVAP